MAVGNGTTAKFWEDRWIQGRSISEIAPLLYACIPDGVASRGRWPMAYRRIAGHGTSTESLAFTKLVNTCWSGSYLSTLCSRKRPASWSGSGTRTACTFRTPPISLPSMDRPPVRLGSSSGRVRRRNASNFSTGLPTWIDAGQLIALHAAGCRNPRQCGTSS